MVRLDEVNLRILELLQKDGRMGVADLARAVGRSESTVRERLFAMEREGIIQGYRAELEWQRLGYRTHAILRADCSMESSGEIAQKLSAIPQIASVFFTTGPKPLHAEVRVRDLDTLTRLMEEVIAPLPLRQVECAVVLETLVGPRPVGLGDVPRDRRIVRQPIPNLQARQRLAQQPDTQNVVRTH